MDDSIAGSGHGRTAGQGGPTAAFTLIELLLVISIIGLLMSLMLPVAGMVREAARRSVCASNLRQWGVASLSHVTDHDGQLPEMFGMTGSGYYGAILNPPVWGQFYPLMIHNEQDPYYGNRPWESFGTNVETWRSYGFTEKLGLCPSAAVGPGWTPRSNGVFYFSGSGFGADTPQPGSPGTVFEMQYCYWVGMPEVLPAVGAGGGGWWPMDIGFERDAWTFKPAYRLAARNDSNRLLMTDTIMIYRPLPDAQYRINHARNAITPSYQNLLFVDGRVEGRGAAALPVLEPLPTAQYGFYGGTTAFFWAKE